MLKRNPYSLVMSVRLSIRMSQLDTPSILTLS